MNEYISRFKYLYFGEFGKEVIIDLPDYFKDMKDYEINEFVNTAISEYLEENKWKK